MVIYSSQWALRLQRSQSLIVTMIPFFWMHGNLKPFCLFLLIRNTPLVLVTSSCYQLVINDNDGRVISPSHHNQPSCFGTTSFLHVDRIFTLRHCRCCPCVPWTRCSCWVQWTLPSPGCNPLSRW